MNSAALSDRWRDAKTDTDPELAQRIRADEIDIAVDLSGHYGGCRIPALMRRPAPVQATYCGYPTTTGAACIDARFVDSITDPPGGSDSASTERLIRLDPCFLCYRPWPRTTPPVAELPSASARAVRFGSFNSTTKVSPGTLDLWAAVLSRTPGSTLLLKSRGYRPESVRTGESRGSSSGEASIPTASRCGRGRRASPST